MLEPSGLYYPNRIARLLFSAMDDVLGKGGLATLLSFAQLNDHLTHMPPDDLARRLSAALGRTADSATVHYCGSGVSACHNLLAQAHAGLGDGRLYVGSWSEWCRHADARSSIMR